MKSIMKEKGFLNLSLCLITVLIVSSCASGNYREVAEESKSDVAKISDGNQAPHKFHSKRFEAYNER